MIVPEMRRKDLEITDINEIAKVFDKAKTIHLAMNNGDYPLILPLSYGYEVVDGKIIIYFHGGFKGIRYDTLLKDNHVCIETEVFDNYKQMPPSATANFDSVIGFGEAIELKDDDERTNGMRKILEHCGYGYIDIDENLFKVTSMFKVELKEVTCKRKHD